MFTYSSQKRLARKKYTAKWGVQIAGMLFTTCSEEKRYKCTKNVKKYTRHKRSML